MARLPKPDELRTVTVNGADQRGGPGHAAGGRALRAARRRGRHRRGRFLRVGAVRDRSPPAGR
jgi:hypothetical protein